MANDHLDDDEFDDYNPHPYAGGYDISATYGSPLPPSHATCHPVSSPAAVPAPTAPQPRSPLPHQPSPRPQPPAPAQPRPSSPPSPVAEPYYWPKPYDYGDAPPYQPAYATPEVFRGWPFLPGAPCRSACGRDYWRQCMRGLDYLFGHSDGYGERRVGVDCLGVPVYANRKGAVEDAVVVEVAPPATGTVEWHGTSEEQHQSNQSSWYDNTEEETYAQPTTYPSYHRSYEQSYAVSDETTSWFPNQSYQEVYKEEEYQYQEFFSYNEDSKISSQPIFSCNQHFGEKPLHFHVEPPETVSSHKLYYEKQEFLSYNEDNKISSQPIFSYNQHFGEEPLHFHVEPPETVSYKLEYYENFSTYNDQNNVDNLESLGQSHEIQPYTHMPYDQLESYWPSWSLNPGYYQACTEGMAMTPEFDNHTLASGDCWDMSSLFMSPFYPQDIQDHGANHITSSGPLEVTKKSPELQCIHYSGLVNMIIKQPKGEFDEAATAISCYSIQLTEMDPNFKGNLLTDEIFASILGLLFCCPGTTETGSKVESRMQGGTVNLDLPESFQATTPCLSASSNKNISDELRNITEQVLIFLEKETGR